MAELKRIEFGNAADESAASERGADFEGLNRSRMPSAEGAPIEVDAVQVEDGVQVTPKMDYWYEVSESPTFDIEEGPHELMKAQMFEEEDVTGLALRRVNGIEVVAGVGRAGEIEKRAPRESLIWYGSHPDYYQAMLGDRVLVRKDVLELEDACKACHGKGYDEHAQCSLCGGTLKCSDGTPCGACVVLGYDREQKWSCGREKCRSCHGSGWRAGVVIPEVAESKPITGVVVSVGPECRLLKLGDRVIHSRFAGHELTVSKVDSYVMMRESEVLSILKARAR
jgi:co-chaperonin GroES (HSP10)